MRKYELNTTWIQAIRNTSKLILDISDYIPIFRVSYPLFY
jgi:hypothetical protein